MSKRIDCRVVGVKFEGRQGILRRLATKDAPSERNFFTRKEAKLERDPDNEHDSNAIKVIVSGRQIGFVPSSIAEALAPRMDRGKRAEVDRLKIDVYDGTWYVDLRIKAGK